MTGEPQHRASEDSAAASLLEAIRSRAEDIRREELSRAAGRWEAASPRDRQRIERLTQGIVTALLEGARIDPECADSVRYLFGLDRSQDAEAEPTRA